MKNRNKRLIRTVWLGAIVMFVWSMQQTAFAATLPEAQTETEAAGEDQSEDTGEKADEESAETIEAGAAMVAALQASKGLAVDERKAAYEQIRFAAKDWIVGKVVLREPLAIVTEMPDAGLEADYAAKLRVWTGLLARADQDLIVVWDEIWIDGQGAVVQVKTDVDSMIRDYFDAEHQGEFRGKAYMGLYPWAFVPTDREAARSGEPAVPTGGIIDLYGNALDDTVELAETGAVKLFAAIPSQIRNKPKFEEVELQQLPSDISGHWAEDAVVNLMRKGIIQGYGDGTIRPERILTRAEFISLLLHAVHIQPSEAGVESTYPDVTQHWSSKMISAAELYEIVPSGDGFKLFEPDGEIPRIEMIGMLSNALRYLSLDEAPESAAYTDTEQLTEQQQAALRLATGLGLINGFGDHTFRPEDSLTRAQAFVVIARLVEIQ